MHNRKLFVIISQQIIAFASPIKKEAFPKITSTKEVMIYSVKH